MNERASRGGQKITMCATYISLLESNNEFVILGKTLNLEVKIPTVKAFKLKRGTDLFSFTFEIQCKEAKSYKRSEHESAGRVLPREFSQTSTSVSITYGNTGNIIFCFFYKITRRNSFLTKAKILHTFHDGVSDSV